MKTLQIMLSTSLFMAGCTTYPLAEEPADLTAPGRGMAALTELGWEISEPVAVTDAVDSDGRKMEAPDPSALDSQTWGEFIAKLLPGDELRAVRHNAGIGHAIFRDDQLIAHYLEMIF